MKKFKDYVQGQQYLIPPSADELIGENDLVRVVNEILENLTLNNLYARFPGGGAPAFHPLMMLKVLIYAYSQGVYSSRKIASYLKRDLHYRWLAAGQTPDFRSINRFRGEYLKELMPEVFSEVIRLLIERGYVQTGEFFTDGTKIEADANRHKMVWRKNVERHSQKIQNRVQEILSEIERVNAKEEELYQGEDLPEYGKPGAITSKDIKQIATKIDSKLNKKTKKELHSLGEKLKEYEQQAQTMGEERNSYSKTDPEATAMLMKDQTIKPAYNLQVSAGSGFACGYSLHQDRHDGTTFPGHIDTLAVLPERFCTDSAYGSLENYAELERLGIGNFLKYPTFHSEIKNQTKDSFSKERFVYNHHTDSYLCPKGQHLPYSHTKETKSDTLKVYSGAPCLTCSAVSLCAGSPSGRTIQRSEQLERFRSQARENLTSPIGVELRRRRANEVESIFGFIKHQKKHYRLKLRGFVKATTDIGLQLLSFNLNKLAILRNGNFAT